MLATLKKKFGNMKAILPKSKDGKEAPSTELKTKDADSVRAKVAMSNTQQGPTS